jgi:DNA-binding HxlR family transcriptional regulator
LPSAIHLTRSFGKNSFRAGITNATLSDRLKHLEDNDLIARRQYQSNPTRYEYVLTRKGSDTRLLTQALVQIGDK